MRDMAGRLKCSPTELERKLDKLLRDVDSLREQNAVLEARVAQAMSQDHLKDVREIGDVKALAVALEGVGGKELRSMSDELLEQLQSGVVMLGGQADGRVSLVVAVSSDRVARFDASTMIAELAPLVGGRGGGKSRFAQAGGSRPEGLPDAVNRFYDLIAEIVNS